jgi:hypothetical protein
MDKRRSALVFALVLCASVLYPQLRAAASAEESAGIPFGDPAHAAFFNYQYYKLARGVPGETPASWAALSTSQRCKKVKDDEAFLAAKRTELLAKQAKGQLTEQEKAFLTMVWGPSLVDLRRPRQKQPAASKDSPAAKAVAEVSGQVEGVQGNWGLAFDGSGSLGSGAVSAVDAGPSVSTARARETSAAAPKMDAAGDFRRTYALKTVDEEAVLPEGEAPKESGNNTPWAAIGLIGAATAAGGGLLLARRKQGFAAPEAEPEFPFIKESLNAKGSPASYTIAGDCNCTCHGNCGCTCTYDCACTCTCTCNGYCGCTCTHTCNDCGCTCTCTYDCTMTCAGDCGCTTTCSDCGCTSTQACGCTADFVCAKDCGCTATCGADCGCTSTVECGCTTDFGGGRP